MSVQRRPDARGGPMDQQISALLPHPHAAPHRIRTPPRAIVAATVALRVPHPGPTSFWVAHVGCTPWNSDQSAFWF